MPVLWVRVQRLSDYDDFDYDVLPWDIEMVIAEPDAVVDDNAVVAAADAADLRDLQGPDYFENVAQEQQGPARRQRRQPARFRDDAGARIGAQLAHLQANRATSR